MRKKLLLTRWFLLLLLICFAVSIEAQVLTNRTPDKAKIQPQTKPQPSPTPLPATTIFADPLLTPPGTTAQPIPEQQAELAYYVRLHGAKRVLVSDANGRTDDLLKAGMRQQVVAATYQYVGQNTLYIIVPVQEIYSITFESIDPAMSLEIVKGRGNVSPEEAIRYNDLALEKGIARFQLSAQGVGPVRLDSNHDGRFESVLEPSAHVRGVAAKDTRGPEITFEILERDATSVLVSIKAIDKQTGVKSLSYSVDGQYDSPYDRPVRVNFKEATSILGIADDNAGNRSVAVYEVGKHPRN
ncbi:MAG TPA: hypothetical protein VFI24_07385 [Pyrinomonadaceae bacterium]|nr:hypothetical protein [Pyrinomonadaceae bacterium]